jgi:hypothetical protein
MRRTMMMPIGILAAIAAFGIAVMLLWNALVPSIFGLAVINFWQALGLLALTRLLFGGFGKNFLHGARMRATDGFGKNPLRAKWAKMTPQERREFVNRCHRGRGFEPYDLEDNKTEKDA